MKHSKNEIIKYLKENIEIFKVEYNIKKIGIFGSVARNDFNDLSDLDIVVEIDNPKYFDVIGVKQRIEDTLDEKVDIIRIRKNMNKLLKKKIGEDAIYV